MFLSTAAVASSMCLILMMSSGCILEFSFFDDLVPEITAEVLGGAQIDGRSVQQV
ncbi:MAG: hypothetical protein ACK44L_14530 [Burkholderiales bacterium]|jgi:hypothetical protein